MLFKTIGYFLYIILFFKVCNLYEGHPQETWKSAFFKVLPMMHLIFIVMSSTVKTKGHEIYKRTILLGLCFSAAGDVALIWREKNFLLAMLFFGLAQLFYTRAFGFKPRGSPAILVSCLMLAGLAFMYLLPGITAAYMQGAVLLYAVLIFAALWRAWIQMQANPSVGSACAVLGMAVFVVSDLLLASDRWISERENGQIEILGTYYMAQLLLTGSVAYYKPHPYRPADEKLYSYKERLN